MKLLDSNEGLSPATFVRPIDRFRAGLDDRAAFVYVDDILGLPRSVDNIRKTFKLYMIGSNFSIFTLDEINVMP